MEKIEITLLSVAIVAALYGYVQYGAQIPSRKLRPRPFTWLIWGILSTCVSVIQLSNGASFGAVGAILGAGSGYILGGMAWFYGARKVYVADIASLVLAGTVLTAWAFVGDAATVIMATAVYLIGFVPTVIRAWRAPQKEGRTPFAMSVLKYAISFALLGTVTVETAAYPVILALANLSFLIMITLRSNMQSR